MKYCEDCSYPIDGDSIVTLKFDPALDADDGYGDYYEIYLCKECSGLTPAAPDPPPTAEGKNNSEERRKAASSRR